ncbi:helix-turn-helix transcriptional regulator [Streptomyces sp. MI02-7b]|uniref:helix-turn-helix domain-containing protein n=1 Tax=Streptomyces sp. MI02-7b TaxID=462941 RepID=UPI0029B87BAA|nr:helix-turn-helix transcriptional regulator [Streptomyces sp. MI02-7b]MDX3071923.1 helix-turn-helix transcriptional regulator [Streptomyces sp. MI02-7b]
MASETSPPPMAWRYCGNQVKLWREQAGVSREQLADEAGYGCETVRSMELGRRRPTIRLLQVADQMCGAGGKLTAADAFLKPERFPSYALDFMRYEAEAIARYAYEAQYVPGLLQTEEYAHRLLASHWPPLGDETVEERVAARLERQNLLGEPTKSFSFVVEEAALRRRFGDRDAHARQLEHLQRVGERRNVTIQVMAAGGGFHCGLLGPFVLLETPEHDHMVYEEGQTTGVLYAEPDKVSIVMRRQDMIARQALGPEQSARFMRELAEAL